MIAFYAAVHHLSGPLRKQKNHEAFLTIQVACNINLDANRSISNGPHSLCKSEKTSKLKDHSVELLIWLDSVSTSTQAEPDVWQTLSQMSLSVHHSQIS